MRLPRLYGRLDQLDSQALSLFDRLLSAERTQARAQESEVRLLSVLNEVQSQLIVDLRAEMVAQGDFAVERAVEVA